MTLRRTFQIVLCLQLTPLCTRGPDLLSKVTGQTRRLTSLVVGAVLSRTPQAARVKLKRLPFGLTWPAGCGVRDAR